MSDADVMKFSLGGLHIHLSRTIKQQYGQLPMAIAPPGTVAMYEVERQFDDDGSIVIYVLVEDRGRPDGEPSPWYVNATDPRKWMTMQGVARRKTSGKDAGWVEPSVKVE